MAASAVLYDEVSLDGFGKVAVLTLKSPPVNALGFDVRQGLQAGAQRIAGNKLIKAAIIRGHGDVFCAGADISEFSGKLREPQLIDVIAQIDALEVPTIAAIHGAALGGGLELALGCNYRIALSTARVGLPEVQLGIIPGAGGTQRLPRLVGIQKALEIITTGKPVAAPKAKTLGILDHVETQGAADKQHSPSDFVLSAALKFITANPTLTVSRVRDRPVVNEMGDAIFQVAADQAKQQARGFLGPLHCIEAIKASATLPFDQGILREGEIISQIIRSPQAVAQQYLFFSERQAAKNGVPPGGKAQPIKSVGVIGAGTMGAGIAINFLNIGIPVVILETEKKFLDAGLQRVQAAYESYVKRGIMKKEQAERVVGLVKGTLNYEDLAQVDMVIEAVFESMEVKRQVFGRLDQVCKPSALLCSNTSTLDVDQIAASTNRPDKVIGTHFFSPAHIMKLLEIVKGKLTSADTIATTVAIGKKIKKTVVVVGNCDGFVGNRMLFPYGEQATFLIEEGATPAQVDRVLHEFGFAVGPFTMWDIAGNDVGWRIRQSKAASRDPNLRYSVIGDRVCEQGRFGQKTSKGWYKYEKGSRKGVEDPEVAAIIQQCAAEANVAQRSISDDEIFWRCMLPLINEGFKILEEGIATCPSDVDVIWIYGYSWPVHRGGPMHFADATGLGRIVELMNYYQAQHPREPHFTPCALLQRLASQHLSLKDYWATKLFARL